jgi:tRNA (guanine37-N1)-methyltransferase
MEFKIRSYDILGNVAIAKFPRGFSTKDKKKFAENILKTQKAIKTVLEKSEKVKGRLRKLSTEFVAGEKTKEVLYRENDCVFRFNIDETYFSPRLSNERKEIASKMKKDEVVLVMFAGVSPYSIVIAKKSKVKKVYSNELNRKANKYAELNISLNKLKDKVELIPGDIQRVAPTIKRKFDVIVMPRPQLKDSFLKEAFMLSKKGTRIYYYDFCKEEDINLIVEKIKDEAKKANKKIKITEVKKAGEIAPYKVRLRVDFKIL